MHVYKEPFETCRGVLDRTAGDIRRKAMKVGDEVTVGASPFQLHLIAFHGRSASVLGELVPLSRLLRKWRVLSGWFSVFDGKYCMILDVC